MSSDPSAPRFPLHETLARFFLLDPRRSVSVADLAALLGTTPELVGEILRAESGSRRQGRVGWPDAAAHLFDSWPREQLLARLGPDLAHLIPAGAHTTRVQWALPIFIVRAMEHQAAVAWGRDPRVASSTRPNPLFARAVDDYVADRLLSEIEPETLAAFRHDSDFLRAYHYPFPALDDPGSG
jgi:hypothetical protein